MAVDVSPILLLPQRFKYLKLLLKGFTAVPEQITSFFTLTWKDKTNVLQF